MTTFTTGRLVSIDALRGVAALAVVLCHAVRFHPYVGGDNWIGRSAAFLMGWGLIGVYLFFVISGFCIHLRWAKQRAKGPPPKIDFLGFWKRRIRRLYPTYLVSLAIYLVAMWLVGTLSFSSFLVFDVVVHMLMLHNLSPKTSNSLNGVYWTLAVEEQLYLLYFLFLRLRVRVGWWKTLAITFATRLAWFALAFFVHRRWGVQITVTEAVASAWFCWVLGALGVEAAFGLVRLPRWCTSGFAATLILGASVTLATVDRAGSGQGIAHDLAWLMIQPLWGVGFFVLVNWAVGTERKVARHRGLAYWWARLGFFSYSLYLTHELILTHLVNVLARRFNWSTDLRVTLSVTVFVVLSVLVAWVFFRLFERPFMPEAGRGKSTDKSIVVTISKTIQR